MSYVDGFVVAVPTATLFKENGALTVVECWGDDVPDGKLTSFPLAVQRKPDETVVFFWISWPSKSTRDSGMKKATEDPRLTGVAMPFDADA